MILEYPDLFEDPQEIILGAVARGEARFQNGALTVGSFDIEELHFSTPGLSLDDGTRTALTPFLVTLVDELLRSSLNDGLPALPVPSFTLPPSVASYGLPSGAELGITSPSLHLGARHIVLEGSFGIQLR